MVISRVMSASFGVKINKKSEDISDDVLARCLEVSLNELLADLSGLPANCRLTCTCKLSTSDEGSGIPFFYDADFVFWLLETAAETTDEVAAAAATLVDAMKASGKVAGVAAVTWTTHAILNWLKANRKALETRIRKALRMQRAAGIEPCSSIAPKVEPSLVRKKEESGGQAQHSVLSCKVDSIDDKEGLSTDGDDKDGGKLKKESE